MTDTVLERPVHSSPDADRYQDVLTTPHVGRLLVGAVTGHLPVAMAPPALLLAVRADHGTLALAGLLAAIFGLTAAFGQPLWGRCLDRRGHTLTLAVTAVASSTTFAVLATIHTPTHPWTAAVLTAIAGLTTPPLEAALRVLWPHVLRHDAQRRAALALDASAQEVVFIAGPLLVLALEAITGPRTVLTATAVIGLAGTALFATTPPARTWQPTPTASRDWLGPLAPTGTRLLAVGLFGAGVTLGALNVVALTTSERHHAGYLATLIPAALAVGSLTGGLLYGRRQWRTTPAAQLRHASTGLLLGLLPLLTDPPTPLAIIAAALPGLFLAPTLITCFTALEDLAPAGTLAEATAWLIASLGLGQAAGTALASAPSPLPQAPTAVALLGAFLSCLLFTTHQLHITPVTGQKIPLPTKPSTPLRTSR
ncbi:MFS transporter [Streptomyces triculaminicus]|uniref:MFS transporter n=1 Tax=Streptomyces triculaminicus TaxID=2816232 RepID=UPI0037D683F2